MAFEQPFSNANARARACFPAQFRHSSVGVAGLTAEVPEAR
jgi:hypothetical protein